MSAFSELFNRGKRELNKELSRKKPQLIENIRKEFQRARDKGEDQIDDVLKDALLAVVSHAGLFSLASLLVSSLIESIDLSRYTRLGTKGLDKLEAEVIKRIQGARL